MTDSSKRTDLSLNYAHRLGVGHLEVFGVAHVYNLFNQFDLYNSGNISTTVYTNRNRSSLAAFDPFTTDPVEGTNWAKATNFGQATARGAYTMPRTFDFNIGFRF